ncbi:MAG: hypothetical protein JWN68_690, partial [Nocardioides sp.]|nr:hypothetical protein [Nocardioides sp.]
MARTASRPTTIMANSIGVLAILASTFPVY